MRIKILPIILVFGLCFTFLLGIKNNSYAGENWGYAYGFVRDALTEQPIDGAKVILLRENEEFDATKNYSKTTGITPKENYSGWYRCEAVVGEAKKKKRFDILSAMIAGDAVAGFGSKKSKKISTHTVKLKVTKEGYKDFYGKVRVYFGKDGNEKDCGNLEEIYGHGGRGGMKAWSKGHQKEAARDRIFLNDVYLAPLNSDKESYVKDEVYYFTIQDAKLEKESVKKGDKVKVFAKVNFSDEPWLRMHRWKLMRVKGVNKEDVDKLEEKKKITDLFELRNPNKGKTNDFEGEIDTNNLKPGKYEFMLYVDPGPGAVIFLTGEEKLEKKVEKGAYDYEERATGVKKTVGIQGPTLSLVVEAGN